MKIEIKRWGDNDLYTEGQLFANGRMAIPYTVEYHNNKVPTGTYEANLKKCGERFILSFTDESGNERIFIAGHSFHTSCKESAIVMGNLLIPGAVPSDLKTDVSTNSTTSACVKNITRFV